MAYFYSLRGWLETEHDSFEVIAGKLAALQSNPPNDAEADLYMKGWCWSSHPINWTRYIFYGADVRIEGLRLFETVLDALTGLDCHLDGYFHAEGEDHVKNLTYKILDDKWDVKEASPLIRDTEDSG